jgi:hypothetical protein
MENVDTTVPVSGGQAVPPPAPPEDSCCVRLSERDAEQVLASAANPPAPTATAIEAAKRFMQKHG